MPPSWIQRLTARLIRDAHKVQDPTVRCAYGALEAWTSIGLNTLLFILKLAIGLAIHSVALIADAVHTLSDCATSVVVLVGFRMARRAPDVRHPYGHGRWETIATLIVAVLLLSVCLDLLQQSVGSIFAPRVTAAPLWAMAAVAATIPVKEALARFSLCLGHAIKSKALIADAVHHRSDVFATAMVVVSLAASRFGLPHMDGVMGMGVSLMIAWTAFTLIRETISPLLGEGVTPELLAQIEAMALRHPGILGVHEVTVHQYGFVRVISLHIEVSDRESVGDLHALSEKVEAHISSGLDATVVAHMDPVNPHHPRYAAVAEAIQQLVHEEPRLQSYHDLRLIGPEHGPCKAVANLVLAEPLTRSDAQHLTRRLARRIRDRIPGTTAVLKLESPFVRHR